MMKMDVNILKIKLFTAASKLQHCKPHFKYAAGALGFGFLISFITPIYDFFSLTPSHIFNFQLWKILSYSFFEPNLIILLYQLVVAYQFFHLVEPVWGYAEAFKYAAIVQLITPLFISFLAILRFALLQSFDFYYYGNLNGFASLAGAILVAIKQLITPLFISILAILRFALFQSFDFYYYGNLNGFASLAGAILVAIKQFLPDTVLIATPFGRIKNTHLPAISVALAFVLWIFGLVRGTVILQIAFGVQIGWTYLRFYQTQHDTNEIGDHNEHFAWATLFPRRSQPYVALVGKAVFRSLKKVGICKRVEYTGFEQFEPVDVILPTTESRDAERRR
uniref:Uncharacterized protein n=1 Tax=Panagrolaimus sp. PS1159 TaxID=55785 RepID=A0AC35GW13_9BILA